MYSWPQRPQGLVELGFKELAKHWEPILKCEEYGIDLPMRFILAEHLDYGITFERFLAATGTRSQGTYFI